MRALDEAKKTIPAALVVYVLTAAAFLLLVPPLETPDEQHHLNYVNFVSRNLVLPDQYAAEKCVIGEGHQFPLYYMTGAAVVRLFDADGSVDLTDVPNKKHRLLGGDSLTVPSFRHAGVDIFKARSDRLAFYALRVLSLLFGLITIVFIYRLAKLFFEVPVWAGFAAVLAATLPQFVFISISVSNDGLSNTLAAASLFYMAKIAVSKDSPKVWKDHLRLGIALGLGILAKKSGLVLLAPAAIVLIRSAWLRRPARRALRALAPAAATVVIIAILTGWVFARNRVLYGEFLGSRMEMKTLEPLGFVDEKTPTAAYVLNDFLGPVGTSFVAMFGQWASFLPPFVYYFYLALLAAGLAGVIISLIKKGIRAFETCFLLVVLFAALGAVFYYNLTFTQPQGRLIFPALGAIAVLVALGVQQLFSRFKARPARRVLFLALILALLAIDVITVFHLYRFYHDPAQYAAAFFTGKWG